MKQLTSTDIEQIILMAWADTIPFETLYMEYGLREDQVKQLMRQHQAPKTYARWRERVTKRSGRSSKHWQKSAITSAKQKY